MGYRFGNSKHGLHYYFYHRSCVEIDWPWSGAVLLRKLEPLRFYTCRIVMDRCACQLGRHCLSVPCVESCPNDSSFAEKQGPDGLTDDRDGLCSSHGQRCIALAFVHV